MNKKTAISINTAIKEIRKMFRVTDKCFSSEIDESNYHKATVEELIELFKEE